MKDLVGIAYLFLSLTAIAQPKKILLQPDGMQPGRTAPERFYSSSPKSYRLSISIDELGWDMQQVKTGETFTKLWFKNSLPDGRIGEPELPSIKKLIRIPLGTTISARVSSSAFKDILLSAKGIQNPILPVQPSARKDEDTLQVPFHFKAEAYRKSSFQNTKPEVALEILGNLRSYTIARLTIRPVEYSPASKKIRVFSNVDVVINIEGTAAKSPSETDSYYSPYFDVVYNTMLNAGGTAYDEHPNLTRYPVGMLIISHRMFETALQPFVQWKTQKGFNVTVKYTDEIGTTSEAIKTFIQNFYNSATPEIPAPTFLLIAGDVEQVPASTTGSQSGKLTDLYYASVDGDKFPEMYYGRLSATSESQLTAIINKILYYEKFQFTDASYLNNATLIAGADATWNPAIAQPTIKYATTNHFNSTKGWSSIYEFGVSSDPNNPLAIPGYTGCYEPEKIAVGFINYTAHCSEASWQDPALSISAVKSFINNQQYPFVIANCCLSGNFGYPESVGEAWLRKANGGAVTYIGSSPNSYWKEDMYWAVGAFPMSGANNGYVPTFEESTTGAYDAPFMSSYTTAGAIMLCGNLAVTQAELNDYSRQINSTYYWEAYNILGDPSLVPYFKTPEANQVTFPSAIPVGISSVNISAKRNSYVSLLKNGQIIGTKFFDADGELEIAVQTITEPGPIILTVSRPQTRPFIDTINAVVANEAYLTISEVTINDSEGNANGVADYGETVKANLFVKNVGKTNATNAGIKVLNSTGLITLITADSIGIGDIDAESGKWINDAFTLAINSNIDDKYSQSFPVNLSSVQGTWNSGFKITAAAPNIKYNGYSIIDTLMGNGNGLVEPGEIVELEVEIKNTGTSAIPDLNILVGLPDSILNKVAINFEPISNLTLLANSSLKVDVRLSTSHDIGFDQIPLVISISSPSFAKANKQIVELIQISISESYNMQNSRVKTCNAVFYDSGGPTSNYSNYQDLTMTFETLSENQKIRVEFLNFSTEQNYDYLYTYDGCSTSSPMFAGSPYHGNILPPVYFSSGNAVTFRFTSDGTQTSYGWKAKLECYTPNSLPLCVENPKPANNELNVEYSTLSWDATPDALFYDIYIGTHPDSLAYIGRTSKSNTNVSLLPLTTYYWRIVPGNHIGLCDKNCELWSFTTSSVVGQFLMSNTTVVTDSVWFYDSGGDHANYGNNENYVLTFKPKSEGQKIKVDFIEFEVEPHSTCSYDRLIMRNGPNITSEMVGTYCGTSAPPSFVSTSTGGELTFEFISDVSTTGSGWKAKISSMGAVATYPLTFNFTSGGSPIPNVAVSINGATRFSNANGNAVFNLPNGTFSYSVSSAGYANHTSTVTISGTGKTEHINLVKLDTIHLHVYSATTLLPVNLARIEIDGESYYTSPTGTTTIAITPGVKSIHASAKGFEAKDSILSMVNGQTYDIGLQPTAYNIQLVVTNKNGDPIENAQVNIDVQSALTNNMGRVNYTLTYGIYKTTIHKDEYVDSQFWIKVDKDSVVNIYMNPIIGNVFSVTFNIHGNGPKGTLPLTNALVKIFRQGELYQQGITQNGLLNLYLPNSSYTYEISCEGYAATATTNFIVDSSPVKLNVILQQLTFPITFNVQSGGNPVAGATVTLTGYPTQQTDADGKALFNAVGYEKNLPFTVTRSDYYDFYGTVDATKNETISVNLTPTSIQNHTELSLHLYPNPATNHFRIESSTQIESYTIYSSAGIPKLIKLVNGYSDESHIDFSPGIYLIKLRFTNGKYGIVKLVVQ